MNSVKATVQLKEGQIVFEGSEEFVEKQVKMFALPLSGVQGATSGSECQLSTSEKDLVKEKNPKGHSEVIAVLAYHLRSNGKEDFDEEELKKAYIRAGIKFPKAIGQAIRDAGKRFDYVEVSARGRYRLSDHGERTVMFDLPRKEGE